MVVRFRTTKLTHSSQVSGFAVHVHVHVVYVFGDQEAFPFVSQRNTCRHRQTHRHTHIQPDRQPGSVSHNKHDNMGSFDNNSSRHVTNKLSMAQIARQFGALDPLIKIEVVSRIVQIVSKSASTHTHTRTECVERVWIGGRPFVVRSCANKQTNKQTNKQAQTRT